MIETTEGVFPAMLFEFHNLEMSDLDTTTVNTRSVGNPQHGFLVHVDLSTTQTQQYMRFPTLFSETERPEIKHDCFSKYTFIQKQ